MTKKIFAVVLSICLICSTFVFAENDSIFDVIPYDFEISWNGSKFDSDSPVLLINGQTYVPLRDWAEQIGMDVHWDGESRKIQMTESGFWFEDVFFDALGFDLPLEAEVVEYAYGRYGRDISLHTKIFFGESDLAYIKKQLDGIGSLLSEDEMDDEEIELINMSKKYDWWDISSPKDAEYAYFGFMEGFEVITIPVWGLICKAPDSDGYYLYISL